ncbi:hypothetical protein LEP1GSC026_3248 [Leptospira interrogans str. 2002000623]|nr:hypothetical protein LEP1GSC026_3248 [Leptospira interrogans str. 2002000623]
MSEHLEKCVLFYPSDSKILFNLWGWLWLSPMFLVSIPSANFIT